MRKRKADRTVCIGMISMLGIVVLLFTALLLEIFTKISYINPLIFAGYTIFNVVFWCNIINTRDRSWGKVLLNFVMGFIAIELLYIIPYIIILFIKSII